MGPLGRGKHKFFLDFICFVLMFMMLEYQKIWGVPVRPAALGEGRPSRPGTT